MKKNDFSIQNFDGGLNESLNRAEVGENQFSVFENIRFGDRGLPEKIYGKEPWGGSHHTEGYYEFEAWAEDDTVVSTDKEYIFEVESSRDLIALFSSAQITCDGLFAFTYNRFHGDDNGEN